MGQDTHPKQGSATPGTSIDAACACGPPLCPVGHGDHLRLQAAPEPCLQTRNGCLLSVYILIKLKNFSEEHS